MTHYTQERIFGHELDRGEGAVKRERGQFLNLYDGDDNDDDVDDEEEGFITSLTKSEAASHIWYWSAVTFRL